MHEKSLEAKIPDTNAVLSERLFGSAEQIKPGYEIVFLGFPLTEGIKRSEDKKRFRKKPIFRSGKVASKSYEGKFLIDAMINQGNSGSPVFIREGYIKESGEIVSQYDFVGIIRGFKSDSINFDSSNNLRISIPHNAGLGEVISIETIKGFLDSTSKR